MSSNKILKQILITVGWLFMALGVAGLFLPLLPTTPFVLLAAACFAKSSARLHQWLLRNRWLGPYIACYRQRTPLSGHRKIALLVFILAGFGLSLWFCRHTGGRIAIGLIGLAVLCHLFWLYRAKSF